MKEPMPTATETPFTPQAFNAMENHPAVIARWFEAKNYGFAKLDGIVQTFFIHARHFPDAEHRLIERGQRIRVNVHYQITKEDKPAPCVYEAWIEPQE